MSSAFGNGEFSKDMNSIMQSMSTSLDAASSALMGAFKDIFIAAQPLIKHLPPLIDSLTEKLVEFLNEIDFDAWIKNIQDFDFKDFFTNALGLGGAGVAGLLTVGAVGTFLTGLLGGLVAGFAPVIATAGATMLAAMFGPLGLAVAALLGTVWYTADKAVDIAMSKSGKLNAADTMLKRHDQLETEISYGTKTVGEKEVVDKSKKHNTSQKLNAIGVRLKELEDEKSMFDPVMIFSDVVYEREDEVKYLKIRQQALKKKQTDFATQVKQLRNSAASMPLEAATPVSNGFVVPQQPKLELDKPLPKGTENPAINSKQQMENIPQSANDKELQGALDNLNAGISRMADQLTAIKGFSRAIASNTG